VSGRVRCRHRKTWFIVNGHAEWCYQCGAWRPLRHVDATTVAPAGKWTRPTGPGGENPALKDGAP
jgi:hypothetical protein